MRRRDGGDRAHQVRSHARDVARVEPALAVPDQVDLGGARLGQDVLDLRQELGAAHQARVHGAHLGHEDLRALGLHRRDDPEPVVEHLEAADRVGLAADQTVRQHDRVLVGGRILLGRAGGTDGDRQQADREDGGAGRGCEHRLSSRAARGGSLSRIHPRPEPGRRAQRRRGRARAAGSAGAYHQVLLAREVDDQLAGALGVAADRDLVDPAREQRPGHGARPDLFREHHDAIAQGETVGQRRGRAVDRRRRRSARDPDRGVRVELAARAVPDRGDAIEPRGHVYEGVEQRLRRGEGARHHQRVVGGQVRVAHRIAAEMGTAVREQPLEQVQVGAQLQELRGQDHAGLREVDARRHLLAVLDERLVGEPAREEGRHDHHEARLAEAGESPGGRIVAVREQRRLGMQPLEHARDDLGVAVDIGADLQRRGAAIAARELGQIRLRHHDRDLYRAPGESLEAEDQPDLLRIRRDLVVVEDQLVHVGTLPRLRAARRQKAATRSSTQNIATLPMA